VIETIDTSDRDESGEKMEIPNRNVSDPSSFSGTSKSVVEEPESGQDEPQVNSDGDVVAPSIEVEGGTIAAASKIAEGGTTEDDGEPAPTELSEQEVVKTELEKLEVEQEQGSELDDVPVLTDPIASVPVEDVVVVDEAITLKEVEPEVAESVQEIVPEVPLEQGSIKVLFSGDCWFTLKNGEGKTVIADLKKAGDEINYSGSLPFSVVVGAVSEVTMHFDDTPIDFSTVRVRNNRASLELTH